MSYTWKIANQDEFPIINSILINSGEKWDTNGIRNRIVMPLLIEQLIIFYKNGLPCGFVTYALMDGQSACHQATLGVQPADWRSGEQLWVVDLVALNGDGNGMFSKLKEDVREAVEGPVRYFRLRHKRIKRVELVKGED